MLVKMPDFNIRNYQLAFSLATYLFFGLCAYWGTPLSLSGHASQIWKNLVIGSFPLTSFFVTLLFLLSPWKHMRSLSKGLLILFSVWSCLFFSRFLAQFSTAVLLSFGEEVYLVYPFFSFPFYEGYLVILSIVFIEGAFLFELSSISRSYHPWKAHIQYLIWNFLQICGMFFLAFSLLELFGVVSRQQQTELFTSSRILLILPMFILVRNILKKVSRKHRIFGKKVYDWLIGSTSLSGWITGMATLFGIVFPVKYPDVLVAYFAYFLAAWSIAVGATIARATKTYEKGKVNLRGLSKNPMLYVVYSLLLAWLLVTLLYCQASIIIHL